MESEIHLVSAILAFEMFSLVTVRTEKFNIGPIVVFSIPVFVMYLKDFRDRAVSTRIALWIGFNKLEFGHLAGFVSFRRLKPYAT